MGAFIVEVTWRLPVVLYVWVFVELSVSAVFECVHKTNKKNPAAASGGPGGAVR